MKTFNTYRLLVTSLSPIHIGTGESYEPTNYVIEGDTLHEFDTGSVVESLSATDRQMLNAIVNRTPDDGMIKAVQQYFHDRRAMLMPRAVHRIPVQAGVATLYRARVGQIAQQEGRGRRVINQLEIGRTAYNPATRLPVLLGSSIKGAIRTALLDQVNAGKSTTESKGLHPFQGKAELFRYYDQGLNPHRDPMRLVHISDAAWQGEAGLPAAEIVFAVNRKKAPAVDRQGTQRSTRADSGPPQILECVPALRYRAFAGRLNVQLLGDVNKPGQVPATDLRFDLARIVQACNTFYRPILQSEIDLLSQRGLLDTDWGNAINEMVNSSLSAGDGVFLLRVGRHSGAESVTLNGVRQILIRGGRNRPDRIEKQATTIWLAAKERDQESRLLPFGWLLVELDPLEGAPIGENSVLKEVCERRLTAVRQWADRVKSKEIEWQRKGLGPQAVASGGHQQEQARPRCSWVEQKLAELSSKPGIKPDDALRGSALAEAVRGIEDATLRAQALADVVARWQEKGWWDNTTGGSAKKAKAIYEELLKASP